MIKLTEHAQPEYRCFICLEIKAITTDEHLQTKGIKHKTTQERKNPRELITVGPEDKTEILRGQVYIVDRIAD